MHSSQQVLLSALTQTNEQHFAGNKCRSYQDTSLSCLCSIQRNSWPNQHCRRLNNMAAINVAVTGSSTAHLPQLCSCVSFQSIRPMFCPGEEALLQIAWPSIVLAVALEVADPMVSANIHISHLHVQPTSHMLLVDIDKCCMWQVLWLMTQCTGTAGARKIE